QSARDDLVVGGAAEAAISAQPVLHVSFDCRFDLRLRLLLVDLNNWHFNLLFISVFGTAGSDLRSRSRTRRIGRRVGSLPAVPVFQSCLVRVPSCWKAPFAFSALCWPLLGGKLGGWLGGPRRR